MESIEAIYSFIQQIEFYLQSEYDPEWFIKFKDYRNSVYVDYALTDAFICHRTAQYTTGIIVDILKMKS
jgi:hypothetical protein